MLVFARGHILKKRDPAHRAGFFCCYEMTLIPSYITHYYERANGPLLNITDLNNAKAELLLEQIRKGDTFNSKRDKDYQEKRIRLEKRMKDEFMCIGGKPQRNNPYYFVLGKCPWMQEWYHDTAEIQLEWKDLPSECISFSYPDSMVSFEIVENAALRKYLKPFHGKLYRKDQIEEIVKEYGLPGELWKKNDVYFFDRCIEVQIWDDAILAQFLK